MPPGDLDLLPGASSQCLSLLICKMGPANGGERCCSLLFSNSEFCACGLAPPLSLKLSRKLAPCRPCSELLRNAVDSACRPSSSP